MKKYLIIPILYFCIIFSGCSGHKNILLEDLPNIVIIVVDTLRADHLSFYGYKENSTPFLSKIVNDSILFENTFSASSWTAPATASLFTSLYPFQHNVNTNMLATIFFNKRNPNFKIKLNRIPEEIVTLGEVFKQKGYTTFGFADNINIGEKEGFDQGFDKMITTNYKNGDFVNKTIIEHMEQIKSSKKYFLYIHYMDPHQPNNERNIWLHNSSIKKISDSDPEHIKKEKKIFNETLLYDGEINFIDNKIKELFLQFGWDKNTLIIFTSDHGEELWDHGRWGHGFSLYNEVIRVPLFFYYPDGNLKKNVINENVSLLDILPTIKDFLGISKNGTEEGMSLLPFFKGLKVKNIENRFIYSHLVKNRIIKQKKTKFISYASIYKNYSYIKSLPGKKIKYESMLFDHINDKKQLNNIKEKLPDITEMLRGRFLEFFKKSRKFKSENRIYQSSSKEMKRLKTLGYIDNK